ncbi:MAG: hypothetical protein P8Y71_21095 [Pseudolabrys sp.]
MAEKGRSTIAEAVMGTLMIRCPKTGSAISTGIQTEPATFSNSPVFFARTMCPVCQTHHEWFARAAWIHESDIPHPELGNFAGIDRKASTVAMQAFKWAALASIFAAAWVTAGHAGKPVAVGSSLVLSSAARMNNSSPQLYRSTGDGIIFPEVNRAAKGNRLRVLISDDPRAVTIEYENKQGNTSFAPKKRAPSQLERKPLAHCEPVSSPIIAPVVPNLPGRCLA